MKDVICTDCPPVGYPTDKTRCNACPRSATPASGPPKPKKRRAMLVETELPRMGTAFLIKPWWILRVLGDRKERYYKIEWREE